MGILAYVARSLAKEAFGLSANLRYSRQVLYRVPPHIHTYVEYIFLEGVFEKTEQRECSAYIGDELGLLIYTLIEYSTLLYSALIELLELASCQLPAPYLFFFFFFFFTSLFLLFSVLCSLTSSSILIFFPVFWGHFYFILFYFILFYLFIYFFSLASFSAAPTPVSSCPAGVCVCVCVCVCLR